MIRYLNEEIEKELVATPSADRCTVKEMVRHVSMEILHAYHWGPRLEPTSTPKSPYERSAAEMGVFQRALNRALTRTKLDTH